MCGPAPFPKQTITLKRGHPPRGPDHSPGLTLYNKFGVDVIFHY
jgi:hypothetical protein